MPFLSSSRLAYHCEYKTTAMLCSSGAKDNWQCKLTAVIRRQPCSVALAQTAAMFCSTDLCFVHVRNPSRRRQPPAAAASCICMLFSSALWSSAWSAEWNALQQFIIALFSWYYVLAMNVCRLTCSVAVLLHLLHPNPTLA